MCVVASSFAATVCCEGTVASHLLAATVYKVPLPSRQPLAPPLFAGAFPLEGLLFAATFAGAFPLEGFLSVVSILLVPSLA
jgi:hypothetical protein